jgi:hypothetical protein
MVWFARIGGFGYPGAKSGDDYSFTLFSFNVRKNEYEPVNSIPAISPSGQDYGFNVAAAMCMSDAGTLEIFAPSNAATCDRARISIAAAPGLNMTYAAYSAAAYTEPGVAQGNIRSAPLGFNSSLIYGFWFGQVAGVYSATNGYVEKLTAASAVRNSTALRSSLPTDNTQGSFVKSIALLGGASPNGYLVAGVSDNVQSASIGTCRFQLVNCNGTPVAVGTALTYAGQVSFGNADRLLALGATQVVAFDRDLQTGGQRVSLLNTNSATAPTTLTKGTEIVVPPPSGYLVEQIYLGRVLAGFNAANNFFVSGKNVAWVEYQTVAGETLLRVLVLASTGATNLTMTQLGTDLRGKNINAVVGGISEGPIVSAPGGKVVVFARRNRDGQYEQFTYQL